MSYVLMREGRSIGCVLRDRGMIYRLCAEGQWNILGCALRDRGMMYKLTMKKKGKSSLIQGNPFD